MEKEILRLMSQGLTDDAVRKKLGVGLRTARRMIADLMERLDARSRFEAGANAVDRGGSAVRLRRRPPSAVPGDPAVRVGHRNRGVAAHRLARLRAAPGRCEEGAPRAQTAQASGTVSTARSPERMPSLSRRAR
ncbi:hypothetical protein SGRIM128S_07476 [Streptomyces griseomycini]